LATLILVSIPARHHARHASKARRAGREPEADSGEAGGQILKSETGNPPEGWESEGQIIISLFGSFVERRKVLQVNIVHGVQDVPADFAILPIKLLEKLTNFLTFTRVL